MCRADVTRLNIRPRHENLAKAEVDDDDDCIQQIPSEVPATSKLR